MKSRSYESRMTDIPYTLYSSLTAYKYIIYLTDKTIKKTYTEQLAMKMFTKSSEPFQTDMYNFNHSMHYV